MDIIHRKTGVRKFIQELPGKRDAGGMVEMNFTDHQKGGIFVRIYENGQHYIGFGKDGVRSIWLNENEVKWLYSLRYKK